MDISFQVEYKLYHIKWKDEAFSQQALVQIRVELMIKITVFESVELN